jgi:hypothetical protein
VLQELANQPGHLAACLEVLNQTVLQEPVNQVALGHLAACLGALSQKVLQELANQVALGHLAACLEALNEKLHQLVKRSAAQIQLERARCRESEIQ